MMMERKRWGKGGIGEQCTHFLQAKELVERMNVQLGNHCQFLPQVGFIPVLYL